MKKMYIRSTIETKQTRNNWWIRFVILTMTIGLVQNSTFGRNPVDELFSKYKNQQGIVSMELSSNLLNLFTGDDDELKGMKMGTLTLLTIEDHALWKNVNFYDELKKEIDFNDYQEILRVHEKEKDVIMMALEEDGNIKEFLMIVGGEDNAVIRFTGQFCKDDLEKMKKCNIVADLK